TQAHPVLAAARALAGCHERRRRAQAAPGTVAPTAAVAEIDRDRGVPPPAPPPPPPPRPPPPPGPPPPDFFVSPAPAGTHWYLCAK
ncbi:hypothetical protein, partial [Nocardia farcinica]|uniref:hypothetical protein n=1 Tax=Nocardia farcinica TaxID=37329 RepID=UPI003CC7E0F5